MVVNVGRDSAAHSTVVLAEDPVLLHQPLLAAEVYVRPASVGSRRRGAVGPVA
jgi:hypothetical protein